ncbi:hypothetical protein AGMMS4956_14730 [Bacteroidia bacterium]|nr:hypothetical protein AGMMS4956_14730 [Bacteroidia bacterium]
MTTLTVIPNQNAYIPDLEKYLSRSAWIDRVIVNDAPVNDFKKFNAETIQVIEDSIAGKNLTSFDSFEDYLKQMKINVEQAKDVPIEDFQ